MVGLSLSMTTAWRCAFGMTVGQDVVQPLSQVGPYLGYEVKAGRGQVLTAKRRKKGSASGGR